jgi:tetratricopeptide (TPR) repeat protein
MYLSCSCHQTRLYDRAVDAAQEVVVTSADAQEQLDWSQRGIDAAEAGGLFEWLAQVWGRKGNDLRSEARWEEALVAFRTAKEYYLKADSDRRYLVTDWEIARALRRSGDLTQARELSESNLAHAKEQQDDKPSPRNLRLEAYCLWEIAELNHRSGEDSEPLFVRAREMLVVAGFETMKPFGPKELARLDQRLARVTAESE